MRRKEHVNSDGSVTIYCLNSKGNREGVTTTLDKNGHPFYRIHYSDGVFIGVDRVIQTGVLYQHYSFSINGKLEGEIICYENKDL